MLQSSSYKQQRTGNRQQNSIYRQQITGNRQQNSIYRQQATEYSATRIGEPLD